MARSPYLALLALLGTVSSAAAAPPLTVSDAWVREPPPGATVAAGYLTLHNPTGPAQTVTGVTSSAFERVEMHRTETQGGVARMTPKQAVEIPAGGSASFAPSGDHLMLIGPRRSLKAGDSVDLRVEVSGGDTIEVAAPVRAGSASQQHQHGGHAH